MTTKEFEGLLEEHSGRELRESFIFPVKLKAKEKSESETTLRNLLAERRASISPEDKLKADLLQLRFQIEDYLKNEWSEERKTLGYFLRAYVSTLGKKQNELAREIQLSPAELNYYINDSRVPPVEIMVRLELHSRMTISAENWFSLVSKDNLYEPKTNKKMREQQKDFVVKEAELA